MRGFRWQLLALLIAAVVFAVTLAARSSETPPAPAPTQPAPTVAGATAVATPLPVASPLPGNTAVPSGDGVPTYREALIGHVQRLNPLLAALNPVDRDISSLIFEGLTRTNPYGEPEPDLAKDWVISSDGLEYVVPLRDDILWQDGVPFTADDVIYTMSLLRAADFPGPAELGRFWRTVETAKLGDHLVRFRLTQPLGSFLDMLRVGILPVHVLQGTTAAQLAAHPFNLSPIGTGPYQLEALRADGSNIREVDLRVAPAFRQRPEGKDGYQVDRVRFQLYDSFDQAVTALQAHNVDGLAATERNERPKLLNLAFASPDINIFTQVAPELGVLIFNWANPESEFLSEQRVRVALEVGIDRSSIVERSLPNEAVLADSPIMPGSWAYVPDLEWPAYNPASAQSLLETAQQLAEAEATAEAASATEEATTEATAEATASDALFTFSILTPDDPGLVHMAQEMATQWSQYHLNITVEAVDADSYQKRLESGDFESALVQLSLGSSADPDVYEFWHEGQKVPQGKNYGSVSDRHISEALEKGRQEPSGLNRVIYYQQFQRDFVDRAIAIPMYYPLFTYATDSSVQGIQLGFVGSPDDRFRNIRDWTVSG